MIVFVDKKTNKVVGTVAGRVHSPQQLNIWIPNKEESYRLIINWKPVNERFEVQEKKVIDGYVQDEEGFDQPRYRTIRQKIKLVDYEPDHPQKDLLLAFSEGTENIYLYQVDPKTKEFTKIQSSELEKGLSE